MQHDCGEHYDPPIYDWIPRVANPKVCPRCKVYLTKAVKEEKPKPKPKSDPILLPEKKVEEKKPVLVIKEPTKPKTTSGLQGLLITEEDV